VLNLLPYQYKKELRLDILHQTIIKVGTAVIFMILILAALFLLAQHFLNINLEEAENELDFWQSKAEIKELENLERKVKELNENLILLDNAYKNQTKFSSFLEKLSKDTPWGVRFNSISIKNSDEVFISGYASTRDILLNFKNILEGAYYVNNFDFPLSNLTKAMDINFSLSFKLADYEL